MLSKLTTKLRDFVSSDERAIAPPPQSTFVKGINLGGGALTIAGDAWDAYNTALNSGLSVPGAATAETAVQPVPYAPPNLRRMLNSVIYKPQTLELTQSLPNGTYAVYLWIMENYQTNWHSLEVCLNGDVVAAGIGNLPLGNWERYGPYKINISTDSLHLTISTHNPNIDAHLMGMSVFRLQV